MKGQKGTFISSFEKRMVSDQTHSGLKRKGRGALYFGFDSFFSSL